MKRWAFLKGVGALALAPMRAVPAK